MSRSRVLCTLVGLGAGLLFYLAHRSDHTVSNRLLHYLCGPTSYLQLKHELKQWLPVPVVLRGCLPSALWCFILTSLCGGWTLRAGHGRIVPLAGLFPLLNAGWELIQAAGWTDGWADLLDVGAGIVGWLIAQLVFLRASKPVEFSGWVNWRLGVVMTGVACMGFADLWK